MDIPADAFESSFGRVIDRLLRQVESALAELDLTVPQHRLLSHLAGESMQSSSLASKMDVSRPTVTGVVDGLVARGLVERRPDASDRRRLPLALTSPGARLFTLANDAIAARMESILVHLDPADADAARASISHWQLALDRWREARDARRRGAPGRATGR